MKKWVHHFNVVFPNLCENKLRLSYQEQCQITVVLSMNNFYSDLNLDFLDERISIIVLNLINF